MAAFAGETPLGAPPLGLRVDPSAAGELPRACALLDQPAAQLMGGGLRLRLLRLCGRADRPGGVAAESGGGAPAGPVPAPAPAAPAEAGPEAPVNDPALDVAATFGSHTQSETSVARSAATGTLCAGYNDSYHLLTENNGFSGFSRSVTGGATWQDRGALGIDSGGDPSLVWRRSDGFFYYAALHSSGLGLWKSSDDCATFSFAGLIHGGASDDKVQLAVDNEPTSRRYGRLYAVYTDFSSGRIFATSSVTGGASWTAPVAVSAGGDTVQSAWPAVAPNGDLYLAWTRWTSFPDGPIGIQVAKSVTGGANFSLLAPPLAGAAVPRDATATANCAQAALAGNLRYLPAPQIAAGAGGVLHVVYSYDPDGEDLGDVVDVFYRRSADGGASWGPELRLNDDATQRDQFSPSLALSPLGPVAVSWYDRRLDPANLQLDRFARSSLDGGVSWGPSSRLTGVSSPIRLDPDLPTCYHGDYDQQLFAPDHLVVLWADDRNLQDGHQDADVWASRLPAALFGDGFESGTAGAWSAVFP